MTTNYTHVNNYNLNYIISPYQYGFEHQVFKKIVTTK